MSDEVTSCITAPPRLRRVSIRHEYLGICDGYQYPLCAAAILNQFERWTNWRLDAIEKERRYIKEAAARGDIIRSKKTLWIFMSQRELKTDELFDLFGETQITKSLKSLYEDGYLSRQNNPKNPRDRTLQYQFNIQAVQKAVDCWYAGYASSIDEDSIPYQYDIEAVPDDNALSSGTATLPHVLSQTLSTDPITDLHHLDAPAPDEEPKVDDDEITPPSDSDFSILSWFESHHGALPDFCAESVQANIQRHGQEKALKAISFAHINYEKNPWAFLDTILKNPTITIESRTPSPSSAPPPPQEIQLRIPDWAADEAERWLERHRDPAPIVGEVTAQQREYWETAYQQLQLQLDQGSFETWLMGTELAHVDGLQVYLRTRSGYSAEMLQHRLYRNIWRVFSDVWGESLELTFFAGDDLPCVAPEPEDDEIEMEVVG